MNNMCDLSFMLLVLGIIFIISVFNLMIEYFLCDEPNEDDADDKSDNFKGYGYSDDLY